MSKLIQTEQNQTSTVCVFVAYDGVAIPFPSSSPPKDDRHYISTKKALLLPPCRTRDRLLKQPPLALELNAQEVSDLVGESSKQAIAPAATDVALGRDKERNEDFAIGSVFYNSADEPVVFGCVADGVSTKTFWAERSSRLAALQAYKTLRQEFSQYEGSLDNDWLGALRERLVSDLLAVMHADRELLNSHKGMYPQVWAKDLYRAHAENDFFWYNTTLVICAITKKGGVLIHCGDGGAWIEKTFVSSTKKDRETIAVLESDDDVRVTNIVSLGGEIGLKVARIGMDDVESIKVFLSSDGVDRTFSRDPKLGYDQLAKQRSYKAITLLNAIASATRSKTADPDNMSLSLVSWPPTDKDLKQFKKDSQEIYKRLIDGSLSQDVWIDALVPEPDPEPEPEVKVEVAIEAPDALPPEKPTQDNNLVPPGYEESDVSSAPSPAIEPKPKTSKEGHITAVQTKSAPESKSADKPNQSMASKPLPIQNDAAAMAAERRKIQEQSSNRKKRSFGFSIPNLTLETQQNKLPQPDATDRPPYLLLERKHFGDSLVHSKLNGRLTKQEILGYFTIINELQLLSIPYPLLLTGGTHPDPSIRNLLVTINKGINLFSTETIDIGEVGSKIFRVTRNRTTDSKGIDILEFRFKRVRPAD